MTHMKRRALQRNLLMTSAIGFGLSMSGMALAQQAVSGANSASVEEVVVTAQKRSQNLQAVPISAQVATQESLLEHNVVNVVRLSDTTPGIAIATGAGTTKMYIRGIGSGTNSGFDQAVGSFVDGIYHGRSVTSLTPFLDLERVEILKGPQSTYFGNNAIAGAISVITNQSDSEFNGYLRAGVGDYGQYTAEGAVGVPLTDTLGVRVALLANGQDGWVKNITTGQTVPDTKNLSGRVTLNWKPTDDFNLALKVGANQTKISGNLADQIIGCPTLPQFTAYNKGNIGFCAAALAAGIPTNNLDNNVNGDAAGEKVSLESKEYVLTANYEKWGHTFTSVSGYFNYDYTQFLNAVASAVFEPTPANAAGGGIGGSLPEKYRQFSQEFRVASPVGQQFEYLVGGYYQHDHLRLDADTNYFFLNPTIAKSIPQLAAYLPIGEDIGLIQNENVYAGFGSLAWNINDRLKLSGGLRYSSVEKSYDWNLYFGTAQSPYSGLTPLPSALATLAGGLGVGKAGNQDGTRSDHALLPSAKAEYQIQPQVMTYFSYAKGFLAGGFNGNANNATGAVTASPTGIDYAPEHVDAYEVGLKSQWFDKKVMLNLAAFQSKYQNLQVTVNSPTASGTFVSNVTNAAASITQGIELETQWVIDQNFRILADGGYTDAHYESYKAQPLTQLQTLNYNLCKAASSAFACVGSGTQDLSGQPTIFSPKWNGNVTGRYQTSVANFEVTTELSAIFNSGYFLEATDDPLLKQPGYVRLDAHIGVSSPSKKWVLDLIGKNLTSQNIRTFGSPLSQSLGSFITSTQAPRTFMAELRYNW